jgi:ferredoxin--NADP+ reductase
VFKIIYKEVLADNIKLIKIRAPLISQKARAGQFIILRIHEQGERVPLTINNIDVIEGSITIVVQEIGLTTKLLGQLKAGDTIQDVVGPLGKPSKIENFGNVACVGGGLGTAVLYPITKALYNSGNQIYSIIGAKNKDMLIMEREMEEVSQRLIITTDDGSKGLHGFVTNALEDIIKNNRIDRVIAIGPAIMMKFVSKLTEPYNIPTIVSLNPIMIDGTGMCGGCRVNVDGTTKYTCVDGPEFDGHNVDFDILLSRLSQYASEEKEALHRCKLEDF